MMKKLKHIIAFNRSKFIWYVVAVIWSLITLAPFVVTLISSFKDNSEIYGHMLELPSVWRFENYVMAVQDANILLCIWNSLRLTMMALSVLLIASIFVSYVIAKYWNKKPAKLLYGFFALGLMLPIYSTLIPLSEIMGTIDGFNNYSIVALIYVAFQLPMSVFLITSSMKIVPLEVIESAIIDGCEEFTMLFRIFLPISISGVATSAIIAFMAMYNEYILPIMFITEDSKRTIQQGMMYFKSDVLVQNGPLLACVILALVPVMVMYISFQEAIREGMTSGAVKG